MPKTEKFVKLCNWLQNATAWTKINVWWRPVVLQKNAKKWENFETLQLAAEWHSINKIQRFIKIKPEVPKNNAKNWETLQLAAEWHHSMNKNQSLIKIKPVVPEKNAKNWEICETLQLAAECHSMNKNQCLMKTSSSSEKCKNVRKFWNFTIGCRVAQHEQKSKIYQDQTSSSYEQCKKLRKFATDNCCRVPQHEQKSKFDQDQTSSSWEKCKKVKKILKLYNWLQSATA